MAAVERSAPLEVRATGRTLSGEAVRYGERATDRAERFEPGAFAPLGPLSLNLQHDPAIVLATTGDGLAVTDTPRALEVRAELREGAALTLLRRGALRGLSVEFRALSERRDGAVRVIERASLEGVGLVDTPSYGGRLEVRRRSGFSLRASIPSGRQLRCECSGDAACRFAIFMGDAVAELMDNVFQTVEREVIAAFNSYDRPLASVSRGTLRRAGPTAVAIDLPDDDAGRAVLAAHESAGVIVRPHLDMNASEYEQVGDTLHYSKAVPKAFIVSATDAREGWPPPVVFDTPPDVPDLPDVRSALTIPRRRLWL